LQLAIGKMHRSFCLAMLGISMTSLTSSRPYVD
jgi:hypothetical protein